MRPARASNATLPKPKQNQTECASALTRLGVTKSDNKKRSFFAQNKPLNSPKCSQSGLIFASGTSIHLRVTNQANSIKSLNLMFQNYTARGRGVGTRGVKELTLQGRL